MSKGMVRSRPNSDRITHVDQLDPAKCTMLVKIDDNVVGFDVCSPALVKLSRAENLWRSSVS
jgi:hypothetical protein